MTRCCGPTPHVVDPRLLGDPFTATGAQSTDGKATYVQVSLAGNQGEALPANESVKSVQNIIENPQPLPGVKIIRHRAALGPAARRDAASLMTFTVIIVMLFGLSTITTLLIMPGMVIPFCRPPGQRVAFLGHHHIIGLDVRDESSVMLAIAVTDYAIFPIGRYHKEAPRAKTANPAYYTMFGGTARGSVQVSLVAGRRSPELHAPAVLSRRYVPLAIGMFVVVISALTLGPAMIAVASRFGKLLEPKTGHASSTLAEDRCGNRALARSDFVGAVALALIDSDAAGISHQLQRPRHLPAGHPGQ